MIIEIIGTYAIAVCLLIGAVFAMVGVIGLIKFNDPMTRLHAPTKVGTMGDRDASSCVGSALCRLWRRVDA